MKILIDAEHRWGWPESYVLRIHQGLLKEKIFANNTNGQPAAEK